MSINSSNRPAEDQEPDQPSTRTEIRRSNNIQIQPEEHYSEEAVRPDTRSWNDYRRSADYSRSEAIEFERTNLQELVAGQNNFIGISEEHPAPERIRYLGEEHYNSVTSQTGRGSALTVLTNPIRTLVTLYPRGYPVFEFTDPVTGNTSHAAFPSARDTRLDRNSRIILQALEVSFQDPNPYDWEQYYHGN